MWNKTIELGSNDDEPSGRLLVHTHTHKYAFHVNSKTVYETHDRNVHVIAAEIAEQLLYVIASLFAS